MKVKIVIQTMKLDQPGMNRSEVWSGEMEILNENEYLVKLSILTDGKPEPIVDLPFALGVGHYIWVPPTNEYIQENDDAWHLS